MAGATYPDSRNQFRMAHAVNVDRIEEVLLEIVPVIRETGAGKRWQAEPHGYELVPVFRGRAFVELATRVAVPPGRFVVLGPSRAVQQESLVGSAFLTHKEEGRRVETLLFITPRLFRAGHQDAESPGG